MRVLSTGTVMRQSMVIRLSEMNKNNPQFNQHLLICD